MQIVHTSLMTHKEIAVLSNSPLGISYDNKLSFLSTFKNRSLCSILLPRQVKDYTFRFLPRDQKIIVPISRLSAFEVEPNKQQSFLLNVECAHLGFFPFTHPEVRTHTFLTVLLLKKYAGHISTFLSKA